jgi:hypothetical protein
MTFPCHETPWTEVFPDTNTRLVRAAAGQVHDVDHAEVWRALVDAYAAPIARALRRHLPAAGEAEVRSFFAYLYERDVLARFDRSRSRFRCFVQGAALNFARERRREERMLTDGAAPTSAELAPQEDPAIEHEDETEWASAVLTQAFAVLAAERPRDARLLTGHHGLCGRPPVPHAELAHEFQTSAGAIAVAVHAAHRRLGALLRAQLRYQCPRAGEDDREYEVELGIVLARLCAASPALRFDDA